MNSCLEELSQVKEELTPKLQCCEISNQEEFYVKMTFASGMFNVKELIFDKLILASQLCNISHLKRKVTAHTQRTAKRKRSDSVATNMIDGNDRKRLKLNDFSLRKSDELDVSSKSKNSGSYHDRDVYLNDELFSWITSKECDTAKCSVRHDENNHQSLEVNILTEVEIPSKHDTKDKKETLILHAAEENVKEEITDIKENSIQNIEIANNSSLNPETSNEGNKESSFVDEKYLRSDKQTTEFKKEMSISDLQNCNNVNRVTIFTRIRDAFRRKRISIKKMKNAPVAPNRFRGLKRKTSALNAIRSRLMRRK